MEPKTAPFVARLRDAAGRLDCTPAEAIALGMLVAGACALLLMLWLLGRPQLVATPRPSPSLSAPPLTPGSEANLVVSDAPLIVHVAGQVRAPGLYELEAGARVADALEAAGGPRRTAVLEALNLARPLTDGEQLLVPDKSTARTGPTAASAARSDGPAATGRLSLGQATAEQLEELPGIGPVLAERIIAHRDDVGGFQSVEQLQDVTGIGEKTYAAIAELVTP